MKKLILITCFTTTFCHLIGNEGISKEASSPQLKTDVIYIDSLPSSTAAWLQICVRLNSGPLSIDYLEEWIKIAYPKDYKNHLQIKDGILKTLAEKNLQQFDKTSQTLSPLQTIQEETSEDACQQTTALLIKIDDKLDFYSTKDWEKTLKKASEWEKYVQAWQQNPLYTNVAEKDKALILMSLSSLKYTLANYPEALKYGTQALEIWKKFLGPHHQKVADSLKQIGNCYHAQANYQKALECFLENLEINKLSIDDNHPRIALSLNNLGACYQVQGKYKQALESYTQALKI